MKAFFSYLSWLFFGRAVKQKLRTGALHSLRLYVNAVSSARKASMFAVLGIMGLATVTVGFFVLVGGLLWFANLNPQAYPWIMVVTGAILTLAGVAGYIYAFRQKFWIEMSQIHELTQKAVSKFPANERPANPAVTAMWAMAAEARIREHSRVELETPLTDFQGAVAVPAPKIETPIVRTRTAPLRPAMHPAT